MTNLIDPCITCLTPTFNLTNSKSIQPVATHPYVRKMTHTKRILFSLLGMYRSGIQHSNKALAVATHPHVRDIACFFGGGSSQEWISAQSRGPSARDSYLRRKLALA